MEEQDYEEVDIGYINIPKDYSQYKKNRKDLVCEKFIDGLYKHLDKILLPDVDRIPFLESVLESTLKTNENEEYYEVCGFIRDCQNILNEDRNRTVHNQKL